MEDVKQYIAAVSRASGLNLPVDRQARHMAEFDRLLREANALSALMGRDVHLTVGPVTVLRHDERAVAAIIPA